MKLSTFIESLLISIHWGKIFQFLLRVLLEIDQAHQKNLNYDVSMETCPKVTFISIRHLPVQIKIHKENIRTKCDASEEYSELCQTSKMKLFAKTLNGFQLLTIVFTVKTFDTYAYSKPSQTSKMKLFPKIINSF